MIRERTIRGLGRSSGEGRTAAPPRRGRRDGGHRRVDGEQRRYREGRREGIRDDDGCRLDDHRDDALRSRDDGFRAVGTGRTGGRWRQGRLGGRWGHRMPWKGESDYHDAIFVRVQCHDTHSWRDACVVRCIHCFRQRSHSFVLELMMMMTRKSKRLLLLSLQFNFLILGQQG